MSDTSDAAAPEPKPVTVTVTLELPARLVLHYDMLTEAGLYLSTHEALRAAILNSYRFERGAFHTLRLDVETGGDKPTGEVEKSPDPGAATEA